VSDTWFGHPRGLSVLFFTEMWERFSYYGMRAILILYMVAPVADGGLGYSTARAATVYGWYAMLVYAMAIPGGLIADRWTGYHKAVLAGGIIIAAGHFSMAFATVETFFIGLALIVCGTGLLKPNVSTMVGALYAPGDPRRDSGFSIFYMGINLGAMSAPIVCGWLGQRIAWHYGFAAAGVGMLLGLAQYLLGRKHIPIAHPTTGQPDNPTTPHEAFTRAEWNRILAITVLFLFAILFWAAYEQAGTSLTLFADRYTRTAVFGWSFPSSWFQTVPAAFVILLSPLFAWMWLRLGTRQPSSATKFALGLLLVGLGFLVIVPAASHAQLTGERVSPLWLVGLYFVHVVGELCLSPVGLSLVTRLAPVKIAGLMMGAWFLATAFGNKLAGWVASYFDVIPVSRLFLLVFAAAAAGSLVLFALSKPFKRLSGEEAARQSGGQAVDSPIARSPESPIARNGGAT
jgi:proton-dependent oligopeptide transporter, POT family